MSTIRGANVHEDGASGFSAAEPDNYSAVVETSLREIGLRLCAEEGHNIMGTTFSTYVGGIDDEGRGRDYGSPEAIRSRVTQLDGFARPTVQQRLERDALHRWVDRHERVQRALSAGGTIKGYDTDAIPDESRREEDRGELGLLQPEHVQRKARSRIEKDHQAGRISSMAAEVLETAVSSRSLSFETRAKTAEYVDALGDPDYGQAFAMLLQDPSRAAILMSNRQRNAVGRALRARALQEGTPAAWAPGSYPVPYQLDPTVQLVSAGAISPLRQISRVEAIVGKEWLGVSSTGVTITRTPESTAVADGTPVLTQPSVSTSKVTAFVPFSVEVEQDWNGLLAALSAAILDAKMVEESQAFVTGAGGNDGTPQGIVTALAGGAQEVTTGSAGALDKADIQKAMKTVAPRFRAGSRWVGSLGFGLYGRSTERVTGKPLLADLPGDGGAELYGWAYDELSSLGDVATGEHVAVCGNFGQGYLIVDRLGSMSMELVPHLFDETTGRPTGERGLFAFWRSGAVCLAPNAFAALKVQ